MRSGRRILLLASIAVAVVAVIVVLLVTSGGTSHTATRPSTHSPAPIAPNHPAQAPVPTHPAQAHVAVIVDPAETQIRIPPGFLGLSMEYWSVEAYGGRHPQAVNPVFVRLIRNLIPNQAGVLRIGGVTTDHTWWPVPGVKKLPALWYDLNQRRLEVMRTLAEEVGAKLILGVTFEADSRELAAAEGRAMVGTIGSSRIAGFELGNEPELYGNPAFAFYARDGRNVVGRPSTYGMAAFTRDFAHIASGLPHVPLVGPAAGAADWLVDLNSFIAAVPRLRVITVHRYPFEACTGNPAALAWPTIPKMLSPLSTVDVARGVLPWVKVAHARGLRIRMGEMNDVACGNPPGIPNTFAMALWALDSLYAYAHIGIDGVNVHTYPGAIYNLFKFKKSRGVWHGVVEPEYYGLLMFARGAPAGSDLVSTASSNPEVRVWATRAADGAVRVTLINDSLSSTHRVRISVRGTAGAASLERLLAPSPSATGGVTLGGRRFGRTTTGILPTPVAKSVRPVAGLYDLPLPPASAALLTIR